MTEKGGFSECGADLFKSDDGGLQKDARTTTTTHTHDSRLSTLDSQTRHTLDSTPHLCHSQACRRTEIKLRRCG